jgi:hypothetical protein
MSRRFLSRAPDAPRRRGPGPARGLASAVLALVVVLAVSCGEAGPSRMAERILDRYRKASGAKPLTAGGMILIRLTRPPGLPGETGREEVLWEPGRYRDTVSSAGMTTVRGIESSRAFFTDGDGVTRVASEPVLRELTTRSYFWRRAWLFEDREKALLRLGTADADSASVRLDVLGGNTLTLAFARSDGRLLRVRSPRFDLDFHSPTRFRELSNPARPVEGELAWTGLSTGAMPHPEVGGGRVSFRQPETRLSAVRRGGALLVDAAVGGTPIRLSVDGAADGPLRLSPRLAARLPLHFTTDVFGRPIAPGASLQVGAAAWPSLFAQIVDAIPEGADAAAGACIFREAVVELDLEQALLGLHDPARWTIPEGYVRIVTDDDGNRPVAIFQRGSSDLRLTAASDSGDAAIVLARLSAERAGLTGATEANDLKWGRLLLPPLRLRVQDEGFFPEWGDDGQLGYALFEHAHTYIDMPRRWTYVRPRDPSR